MTLPTVYFSDSADADTVFSVLKNWMVNVDLIDGRRHTGIVVRLDEPYLVLGNDMSGVTTEIEFDKIQSMEVI